MEIDFHLRSVLVEYSRSSEFRALVGRTREYIRDCLEKARKPFVAFSGGKDSTVMLYLVLQEFPDVMVYHWDYGPYLMPREFEREILHNARILGAKNLRVETSALYLREKRDARNVWGRVYFGCVLPQLRAEGYDGVFVGIRKEESLRRKRRINAQRWLSGMQEFWPLADWTWMDVWASVWGWNLPYPSVYDRLGPVVGWDRVRFVTFFDNEMMPRGAGVENVMLWRFKNI